MSRSRLLVFAASAAFGTLAFFAKLAIQDGTEALAFLLGRFVIAAVLLGLALVITRPHLPTRRALALALGIGALVYGAQAVSLTLALTRIDAALTSVLFGTYPALVLFGLLVTCRSAMVTRRHLVALAGVLVGVTLLVSTGLGTPDALGVGLALLSAALFAGFVLAADALAPRIDGTSFAAVICAGAAGTVALAGVASGTVDKVSGAGAWGAIVAAGAVSTAFAFVAMFAALPMLGPATVGVILGAEPVATVLLSAVFLGEHLEPLQVVGAAFVLLGAGTLGATAGQARS